MMNKQLILCLVLVLMSVMLLADKVEKEQAEKPLQPRIEEIKPFVCVGLVAHSQDMQEIMAIWGKFFSIMDNLPESADDCIYGIHYPGEKYDPEMGEGYLYMVGIIPKDAENLPEGFEVYNYPGGIHAVFEYKGAIEKIGDTYQYIYGEWLTSSDYKTEGSLVFEKYDERFKHGSEESITEIWLPIIKP